MHIFFSPFIIPVVAMLIPIVAIIAGVVGKMNADRLRMEERMALLARGLPVEEVERLLTPRDQAMLGDAVAVSGRPGGAARTAQQIRLTAIILICCGLSMAAFFAMLAPIVQEREVYAGAVAGVIPFGIGIGFLIDYGARKRELERLREEGSL
jgi:hypothetical protein